MLAASGRLGTLQFSLLIMLQNHSSYRVGEGQAGDLVLDHCAPFRLEKASCCPVHRGRACADIRRQL
jgi:hypothetical protein